MKVKAKECKPHDIVRGEGPNWRRGKFYGMVADWKHHPSEVAMHPMDVSENMTFADAEQEVTLLAPVADVCKDTCERLKADLKAFYDNRTLTLDKAAVLNHVLHTIDELAANPQRPGEGE